MVNSESKRKKMFDFSHLFVNDTVMNVDSIEKIQKSGRVVE